MSRASGASGAATRACERWLRECQLRLAIRLTSDQFLETYDKNPLHAWVLVRGERLQCACKASGWVWGHAFRRNDSTHSSQFPWLMGMTAASIMALDIAKFQRTKKTGIMIMAGGPQMPHSTLHSELSDSSVAFDA